VTATVASNTPSIPPSTQHAESRECAFARLVLADASSPTISRNDLHQRASKTKTLRFRSLLPADGDDRRSADRATWAMLDAAEMVRAGSGLLMLKDVAKAKAAKRTGTRSRRIWAVTSPF